MNLSVQIRSVLNLRPGETWIVSMLLLYSFFQSVALALFLTSASAIFLTQFPVSDFPYLYIITAGVLLLIMVTYLKLEEHLPFSQATLVEAAVLLVSVVVLRLALAFTHFAWLAFALMVWHRVMMLLTNSDFVRLSAMIFDVRQSKRLFGVVGSGDVPASVTGYLLASTLVPFIGAPNLLWLSAGGFLLSLVCLSLIVNKRREHFVEEEEAEETDSHSIVDSFRHDLIRQLSYATFFAIVASIFIDFAFLSHVATRFNDQARIATFLGIFFSAGELVTLLVKTTVYSRLMSRFGIQPALMSLPLVLIVITILGAIATLTHSYATALLWLWVVMMFFSKTLRASLYESASLTLLQPLPKKLRLAGHDAISFVEAASVGLSGLALLWMSKSALSLSLFNNFLLTVLIGWLIAIIFLNRSYLKMLSSALQNRLLRGSSLSLKDAASMTLLREKLNSRHPGEVLYAMNLLTKVADNSLSEYLVTLLPHPVPEVRKEALHTVEKLKLVSLMPEVRRRIEQETVPSIQKRVIITYCALGESEVVDEISRFLEQEEEDERKKGAMIGLIRSGGINGVMMAGQQLTALISSTSTHERAWAAEVIGEVGIQRFYHPLLRLLDDEAVEVQQAALKASGKIRNPRLFPLMIRALASPAVFETAGRSLIEVGEAVIPEFEKEFNVSGNDTRKLRRLAYIAGRIGGAKAIGLLKTKAYFPLVEVRNQVLISLSACQYQATETSDRETSEGRASDRPDEREEVIKIIRLELADGIWFLHALEALDELAKDKAEMLSLQKALRLELQHLKARLLLLLSFVYNTSIILRARDGLLHASQEQRANALEMLDIILAKELKTGILPLLEEMPLNQQVKALSSYAPLRPMPLYEYLGRLMVGLEPAVNSWTRVCALHTVRQLSIISIAGTVARIAYQAFVHSDAFIAETALWTLKGLYPKDYQQYLSTENGLVSPEIKAWLKEQKNKPMTKRLLTIEKVMTLKTISIFAETSEDILVDIASIVKEVPVKAGELVFRKDDVGTCMYIIYEGEVRVHDGDFTLAKMHNRDFFGELSLLDPEPRSASITALKDTLLLRLDQPTFYEIMADRIEVTREILKILCRRLRTQNKLLASLQQASEERGGVG